MFAQVFFIVWRESLEALLVIGILHGWLQHNADQRGALRYLWGGVAAGLACAVGLSLVLTRLAAVLPPEGQELFQMAMIVIAAALIVQMVFWMRWHGRDMKRQLERGLSAQVVHRRFWGVFVLALIAVTREGSETVIFLQGFLAAAGDHSAEVQRGIVWALAAAAASYGVLQVGHRVLSWRLFFRLTEAMLLLLACALFVSGVGYLVSFGLLPYTNPVWDTSFLLDDMTRLGGIVADLTGYRAMPDHVTVAVWLLYWGGIARSFRVQTRRLKCAGPA